MTCYNPFATLLQQAGINPDASLKKLKYQRENYPIAQIGRHNNIASRKLAYSAVERTL